MAEVTGLAHVGIYVDDIERSKKFYKDILGLECIEETAFEMDGNGFHCAFVQRGSVCLELSHRRIGSNPGDGMTDHVDYAVDDLEAIIEKLKEKGIEFESEEPKYCDTMFPNGTKWIFFRGPDQEHIELAQVL